MAEASNGTEVGIGMAKDALEMKNEMLPPALEHYASFYDYLMGVEYFVHVLADESATEHDPALLAHVRGVNPGAWDDVKENVTTVKTMLTEYVSKEYPDEVVWALNSEADVEVEL